MWGARLGLVQGWWCAQWSAWARWAEGPVSVQDNTGVWTLTSDSAPVSDCGAQVWDQAQRGLSDPILWATG